MQFRRSMPAVARIPAAEHGVTLGDFFFPVFLGERLGARVHERLRRWEQRLNEFAK